MTESRKKNFSINNKQTICMSFLLLLLLLWYFYFWTLWTEFLPFPHTYIVYVFYELCRLHLLFQMKNLFVDICEYNVFVILHKCYRIRIAIVVISRWMCSCECEQNHKIKIKLTSLDLVLDRLGMALTYRRLNLCLCHINATNFGPAGYSEVLSIG